MIEKVVQKIFSDSRSPRSTLPPPPSPSPQPLWTWSSWRRSRSRPSQKDPPREEERESVLEACSRRRRQLTRSLRYPFVFLPFSEDEGLGEEGSDENKEGN